MICYALSIKQPWAQRICSGFKTIENRDFAPKCIVPGDRLLIHAGLAQPHKNLLLALRAESEDLRFGGIIGSVEYAGLTHPDKIPETDEEEHGQEFCLDTFYTKHWVLRHPQKLPFFPCIGRQGLFKVDYPYAP